MVCTATAQTPQRNNDVCEGGCDPGKGYFLCLWPLPAAPTPTPTPYMFRMQIGMLLPLDSLKFPFQFGEEDCLEVVACGPSCGLCFLELSQGKVPTELMQLQK